MAVHCVRRQRHMQGAHRKISSTAPWRRRVCTNSFTGAQHAASLTSSSELERARGLERARAPIQQHAATSSSPSSSPSTMPAMVAAMLSHVDIS